MNTLRIVVVDDDDAIRNVIVAVTCETLPSASVVDHASSLQALQDVQSSSADLLVTNCHMPDMDGPTLVRTIREEKHAVPVIMVSGSEDARTLGENAGIDRFVSKTWISTELPDAIQTLLSDSGKPC